MVTLRPYQLDISSKIGAAWADGARHVCAVLPTGAGKTLVFANELRKLTGYRFAFAHRQELVAQMSLALAMFGVRHDIHAPEAVIRGAVRKQTRRFNRHFYQPGSRCIVGSVQTLLNRGDKLKTAFNSAELLVIDECHHVLRGNMWGRMISMLPESCRGLHVTATPERPDGKGIGRSASGIVDTMVQGPSARELINAGFLSEYRIFGPYTDIDLTGVKTSRATGDYVQPGLVAAVKKSKITGDVVGSYIDIAPGKIGVTFVPGVRLGEDVAAAFNAAGVPAAMVHAKTPSAERQKAIERLGRGDLKQVVNVDLFGEGFDLPTIEVLSMARPTQSYVVYSQQFGRVLRPLEGKGAAIIIDHVQNVKRHGLPDTHRDWSLSDRESRGGKPVQSGPPVRTCRACTQVYQSWEKDCPYCGWQYTTDPAATIEQVEGDISELSPDVLAAMRGEVARVDAPSTDVGDMLRRAGAPEIAARGAMARHRDRQTAQTALRDAIAVWAGYQRAANQTPGQVVKRFYASYGLDVITAQTLGRKKAEELTTKLIEAIK